LEVETTGREELQKNSFKRRGDFDTASPIIDYTITTHVCSELSVKIFFFFFFFFFSMFDMYYVSFVNITIIKHIYTSQHSVGKIWSVREKKEDFPIY
jgi:hypothetical protein